MEQSTIDRSFRLQWLCAGKVGCLLKKINDSYNDMVKRAFNLNPQANRDHNNNWTRRSKEIYWKQIVQILFLYETMETETVLTKYKYSLFLVFWYKSQSNFLESTTFLVSNKYLVTRQQSLRQKLYITITGDFKACFIYE